MHTWPKIQKPRRSHFWARLSGPLLCEVTHITLELRPHHEVSWAYFIVLSKLMLFKLFQKQVKLKLFNHDSKIKNKVRLFIVT